jgi:hypothetical protein
MDTNTRLTEEQAEHLRLAIKQGRWSLAHWKKLYESLKPDTAPSIEDADPAQLSLFETPNTNEE